MRLPANPKTNKFVLKSKHIWQDWKAFVDKSLAWLVAEGILYKSEQFTCTATDETFYPFYEYYVDEAKTTPLIDYSYCTEKVNDTTYRAKQNDDGTWIGDRWDAWSESDFEDE